MIKMKTHTYRIIGRKRIKMKTMTENIAGACDCNVQFYCFESFSVNSQKNASRRQCERESIDAFLMTAKTH